MENQTKPIAEIMPRVLTELKAPLTKAQPNPTILKRFKSRARFETLGEAPLERALEGAAAFAASVNFTPPYWLSLCGKSGTGKTLLARAVYRQFMDQNRFELSFDRARNRIQGNTAMFVDWRKFCDQIRGGAYELIEDVCDEWLVVIDDLGAERDTTGFIAAATDRILNSRRGKWTLITTNLPLSEIGDRIDPRVASRMIRGSNQVVEIEAVDWNLRA
jgi:DNA replication protein DnaC